MSVPGNEQQQQNDDSGLTEEERIQRRIDAGIEDIIGNDDGRPTLEDFLNDPFLQEKYADEEVQRIFTEIEEDPAKIADHKDNIKVKEVLKRICDIFEPYVNQQNPQQGGPEANMPGGQLNPELIAQQLMGVGNQNPFAQLYPGGEQNQNPFADFSQLMQGQGENPMANLAQLLGGQFGYPRENLGQQFQGQGGNPWENMSQLFQGQGGNQLFQGQGQNPMANLANLFGGQGQGDFQVNEEQLAYLEEYLRNMTH
ncbi:hypothetical protein ACJMK2_031518 [Sinanodonta woodiana]|uniref:Uncharacterized protein n=1 Tax=Sinanodonta woodiana TaxID=1069815 RepID=A0ABD3X0G1_SINWO